MKNNKIENLIEALYSVKMTEQEKRAMREYVLGFERSPIPSPYQRMTTIMYRSLSVAFMALLTIGSLSKPAAAGALPGEFLYPIKMIHEELESVTKYSPEEKISHEIERTNKRIEEATELAAMKTLDPQKEEQIANNIKKHTRKVKQEIKELKIEDPIKALELNHKLQNSIKSNVERLKTKESTLAEAESEVMMLSAVAPENITETPTISNTPENEIVMTHKDVELPEINEVDVALMSTSVVEIPEKKEFDNILKEMEADLKEAEKESQQAERDISMSVIAPINISEEDEIDSSDNEEKQVEKEVRVEPVIETTSSIIDTL